MNADFNKLRAIKEIKALLDRANAILLEIEEKIAGNEKQKKAA